MQCAVVLVVEDTTIANFWVRALSPFYRPFSAYSGEDAFGFCAFHAPLIELSKSTYIYTYFRWITNL
jgi:hypothetical protein